MSLGYDFHLGSGDNGNVYQIVNDRDTNRTPDGWPIQAWFWLEWGSSYLLNSVIPTGADHRDGDDLRSDLLLFLDEVEQGAGPPFPQPTV